MNVFLDSLLNSNYLSGEWSYKLRILTVCVFGNG